MCCREPDLRPRTAIDRFAALWHNQVIQKRLATDWYKDVRKIDMGLSLAAGRIRQDALLALRGRIAGASASGVAGDGKQPLDLKSAYADIQTLANARSDLKPIQKAAARVTKTPGSPRFYVDGIIRSLTDCMDAVGDNVRPPPPEKHNALLMAISNCDKHSSSGGGGGIGGDSTSAGAAGVGPAAIKQQPDYGTSLTIGSAVGKKSKSGKKSGGSSERNTKSKASKAPKAPKATKTAAAAKAAAAAKLAASATAAAQSAVAAMAAPLIPLSKPLGHPVVASATSTTPSTASPSTSISAFPSYSPPSSNGTRSSNRRRRSSSRSPGGSSAIPSPASRKRIPDQQVESPPQRQATAAGTAAQQQQQSASPKSPTSDAAGSTSATPMTDEDEGTTASPLSATTCVANVVPTAEATPPSTGPAPSAAFSGPAAGGAQMDTDDNVLATPLHRSHGSRLALKAIEDEGVASPASGILVSPRVQAFAAVAAAALDASPLSSSGNSESASPAPAISPAKPPSDPDVVSSVEPNRDTFQQQQQQQQQQQLVGSLSS